MHRRGMTPTTQTTHHFKTMTWYQHNLTTTKAATFIARALGSQAPNYDADQWRESGRLDDVNGNSQYCYGDICDKEDQLFVDEKQNEKGSIFWNMDTGSFTQLYENNWGRVTHEDTFKMTNFEHLYAAYADRVRLNVWGTNDNNYITTSDQNDYIDGKGGADVIHSGEGNDVIMALAGEDVVLTGKGKDKVFTQVGDGFARITDFEIGSDELYIMEGVQRGPDAKILSWEQLDDSIIHQLPRPNSCFADQDCPEFDNWQYSSSYVFKNDDLVAVIQGVLPDQLQMSSEAIF